MIKPTDTVFLAILGFALILNPLALLVTGASLLAVYLGKLNVHGNIAAIGCAAVANIAAMVSVYGWQLTISFCIIASVINHWRLKAND